jgi:hypothetical protein
MALRLSEGRDVRRRNAATQQKLCVMCKVAPTTPGRSPRTRKLYKTCADCREDGGNVKALSHARDQAEVREATGVQAVSPAQQPYIAPYNTAYSEALWAGLGASCDALARIYLFSAWRIIVLPSQIPRSSGCGRRGTPAVGEACRPRPRCTPRASG